MSQAETVGEKRATIYDVAARAGVSIATVSRHLNNPDVVSKGAAEKISAAMEQLDYIPQGNAGTRADRAIKRIGVLTPFFPAPSFVHRLEGALPVLRGANYEMIVYTVENSRQLNEYVHSVPFTRRIEGLILMSIKFTPHQLRILKSSGLKIVQVEGDEDDLPKVVANDYQGGVIAAELFIRKNYFPVAYMADKNADPEYGLHPSELRFRGLVETLANHGQTVLPSNYLKADTTVSDAEKVFGQFLDQGGRPRSLFAMSDLQAIGAYRACRQRHMSIPQDLAILGFDDIDASKWMEISTISQHLEKSGQIAAQLLLEAIEEEGSATKSVHLQVELLERSTT